MNHTRGNVAAWTALVIAIIALVAALIAYSRAGVDWDDRLNVRINDVRDEIALETARLRAAADLQRIDLRAAGVRQNLASIREDLRRAFERAGEEASSEWREIEQRFIALDSEAGTGGSATTTLQTLINRLKD